MSNATSIRRAHVAALLVLVGAACAGGRSAQQSPAAASPTPTAPATAPATAASDPATTPAANGPRPTVVIMNASFYGKSANSIEPGDSATAAAATTRIWQIVREANTLTLVDSSRMAALAAETEATGRACNSSIDCARRVGTAAGARWVVMTKVSKTSNLIWYFTGQVIDVADGNILMDDEFELKGQRDEMVPLGARALARRVLRVTERATAPAASGER